MIAIDPGPVESAYVVYNGSIGMFGKIPNGDLLNLLATIYYNHLAIEQIRGFGINAGNSTFDTCVWTGRFAECFGWDRTTWIPRKTIVTNLCGTATAGDTAVREALAYRYGFADLKSAKGTKKAPGPLYGFADDMYSALAVALTWTDLKTTGVIR